MNITLENKVKILEYKLAYEQDKQVENEYKEGRDDLNYRLSFFRQKIIKDTSEEGKDRVKAFDNVFIQNQVESADIVTSSSNITDASQKTPHKNNNLEPWFKKTYRQIVKSTHPDMLIGIKSKNIKGKLSVCYQVAQNAYEQNIPADMIMIAHELDIDVENEVISREIVKPFKDKQKKIIGTQSKLEWQWYHVPIENKDRELKKILLMMGLDFTEAKIKNAIRSKRPTRKVGTRPEKIRVKRNRTN